jgi:hypothetical protein
MQIRNKNKPKMDLLEMSDPEKYKVIKAVKENLQLKVAEAKRWQSLLDAENLTINGKTVQSADIKLTGLSLKAELFRKL